MRTLTVDLMGTAPPGSPQTSPEVPDYREKAKDAALQWQTQIVGEFPTFAHLFSSNRIVFIFLLKAKGNYSLAMRAHASDDEACSAMQAISQELRNSGTQELRNQP